MGRRATWLLLLAGAASCAGEASPVPGIRSLLEPPPVRSGPPGGSLATRPGATWDPAAEVLTLEQAIPVGQWSPAGKERWLLARPPGYLAGDLELLQGERSLAFELGAERLAVHGTGWTAAPDDVRLRLRIPRDAVGEHGGEILALWPGESLSWELPVPEASVLRFRLLALASAPGRSSEGALEVEQDGAPLASLPVRSGTGRGLPFHVLELPAARRARLVLRVSGDAPTWLVAPTVGPREIGTPASRPWPEARPDLVLFLADTFRADLLACEGGAGDLPALDALAARSLRFRAARSPSTWTLPAHTSLFTGLWPGEHGAERPDRRFDPGLVTLAETLRQAGYRTGAVTEAGYVRRVYGLDAGFEWFLEQPGIGGPRLARTLAAADRFLAADDGRPLFLFVHTYRTHWPYTAEDESAPRRAVALRRANVEPAASGTTLAPEALAELRALYTSSARGLDREFGPWFARLESGGLLRRGLFVFTSDHGEAFQEHGALFHGEAPGEEVARIPLFLHGARLAPGEVTRGASLVDLFPTLVRFAGVPVPQGLSGSDLLTLAGERPLLCETRSPRAHHLAVIEGSQKLLAESPETLELPRDARAFHDLALDPGEQRNDLATPAGQAFLGHAREAWLARSRLRGTTSRAELDASTLDELRDLGYGE